jgi:hypothetical protein
VADSITTISIFQRKQPANTSAAMVPSVNEGSAAVMYAANKLSQIAGGVEGGTVQVRVDSVTGAAATGSFTCVQASCTAGDKLIFVVPGAGTFTLTAVSGTPNARAGEYEIITGDTEVAVSVVAAITAMDGLKDHVTAENASGTVTWTAKKAGANGNNIVVNKELTTAAAHVITAASGGTDITQKPTIQVVFGSANIVADDTISIGGVKYTWKASAASVDEITLSTTEATAAANFAAAITADPRWTGLITASVVTATVTLTWEGDQRLGQHIVMDYTETNATSVVLTGRVIIGSGEAFSIAAAGTVTNKVTTTGQSATRRYQLGAV